MKSGSEERLHDLRESKEALMLGLAGATPLEVTTGEVIGQIKHIEKEIRVALESVPEPIFSWPMSHEEVEEWCWSRPWKFAVTLASNPHEHYVAAREGDRRMFELVVLHVREYGYKYKWGRSEYLQYESDGCCVWSMGADLESTILLNRKPVALARYDEKIHKANAKRLS